MIDSSSNWHIIASIHALHQRRDTDDSYSRIKDEALVLAQTEYWQRCATTYHPYLYALVRTIKPKAVVETGIYNGASTNAILAALAKNGSGHLYSCDPMYKSQGIALDRILFAGAKIVNPEQWTFFGTSSKEALPEIAYNIDFDEHGWAPKNWDLFIHDSDHRYENMKWELEFAYKRSRYMLIDDIDWGHVKYPHVNDPPHTAFKDFCVDKGVGPYHKLGETAVLIEGGDW